MEFHSCRAWIVDCAINHNPVPRGTGRDVSPFTILLRELVDEVSADSGLQLDLEIALSVVSAKVQPHEKTQLGRKCVETSGDVIAIIVEQLPNECLGYLPIYRVGHYLRGSRKTPNAQRPTSNT